jgi:hypothetical protein
MFYILETLVNIFSLFYWSVDRVTINSWIWITTKDVRSNNYSIISWVRRYGPLTPFFYVFVIIIHVIMEVE